MGIITRVFGTDATILHRNDFRLILLTSVFAPLGNSIISPILSPLTDVFEVSSAEIGLMVSVFAAPAIVAVPIMGALSDRYGRKPILVFCTLFYGVTGGLISFTTDFHTVLALRFLQGIGYSGLTPILTTVIGDLFHGSGEETAQGLRVTITGVINTIFPLLAGVIVAFSWQYPFLLYTLAIPTSIILYFHFKEPTPGRSVTAKPDTHPKESSIKHLYLLVIQPRVAAILLARSIPSFLWGGFIAYNSLLIVQILLKTPQASGITVAIGGLMVATTASQAGRISSHFNSRYYPLIAAHAGLGVGFGIFSFASSLPIAIVGVILAGSGLGLTAPMYRSIINGFVPYNLRGKMMSLGDTMSIVMVSLGPIGYGMGISVLEPTVGTYPALRYTILFFSLLMGAMGIGCLYVIKISPDINVDYAR